MNIEVETEKTVDKYKRDYEEQLRNGMKLRTHRERVGWLLNIVDSDRHEGLNDVIKFFADIRAKIALKLLIENHNSN